MVVALTWPPRELGRQVRGGPQLETIPSPNLIGERPSKARLLHGDFHGQNSKFLDNVKSEVKSD